MVRAPLERIFSFFLSLSAIPRELIQHILRCPAVPASARQTMSVVPPHTSGTRLRRLYGPFFILSQCNKILCLLRLQYNYVDITVKGEIVGEHCGSDFCNKGTKKG